MFKFAILSKTTTALLEKLTKYHFFFRKLASIELYRCIPNNISKQVLLIKSQSLAITDTTYYNNVSLSI